MNENRKCKSGKCGLRKKLPKFKPKSLNNGLPEKKKKRIITTSKGGKVRKVIINMDS